MCIRDSVCITLADPRSVALGNEPVRIGGEVAGRVTSGGYGYTVERSIAYAYVPAAHAEPGTAVEIDIFGEWIAGEIAHYEDSWLAGRSAGLAWALALGGASVVGIWQLGRRWREGSAWTILLWTGITAVALFIATPLEWQRYYLPLRPPLAVVAGCGVAALAAGAIRLRRWA